MAFSVFMIPRYAAFILRIEFLNLYSAAHGRDHSEVLPVWIPRE